MPSSREAGKRPLTVRLQVVGVVKGSGQQSPGIRRFSGLGREGCWPSRHVQNLLPKVQVLPCRDRLSWS